MCWCVSEIRNCNYNCENSAVPLGTAARLGGQIPGHWGHWTGDTATLEQIDVDNCS